MNVVKYSIIIPQRASLNTIPRLLLTIPDRDDIEILIVDNTPTPIKRDQFGVCRNFKLFWSHPNRHAGGARNVGIEHASGKWLIFADSDDYFTDNAFQVFDKMFESDSDIVYFCPDGIYDDTKEHSERADKYNNYVHKYLMGELPETILRFRYLVPWGKMFKRNFILDHKLYFDEIRAGNDIYFSLTSGYYAKKIDACAQTVYMVTVSKGSLTKRVDYEVVKARLYSKLHCNQFIKQHGLPEFQYSIMFALEAAKDFGLNSFFEFLWMIIKFHQNPFIGCTNWLKTFRKYKIYKINNRKYIVK